MSKWVNSIELADELGISKGRVSQLKSAGVFRLGLTKKFDLDECKKNFRERKSNAPRIDMAPCLPLEDPGVKSKDTITGFKNELQGMKEQSTSHALYVKSKAIRESLKAKRESLLHDQLERILVNKNMIYAAVKEATMRRDAGIKAMIISIPKRLALGYPDPKARAQVETDANKIIHSVLTELSELDISILDEALYT